MPNLAANCTHMKRIIQAMFLGILLFPILTTAQEAKEKAIKMGKKEMPGFVATGKYEKALVQQAIMGRLNEAGIRKHKKKKNFYVFKEITWPDISANKIDLYYKVSKKKHKSKIYFVVSKGYDNYVTSVSDATVAAAIVNFLAQVDSMVERSEEIKNKEREVKLMDDKLMQEKLDVKKAEEEKARKAKELEEMKKNK